MQIITALDYVLLPFFIGLIYGIAIRIRNRQYPPGHPWRGYFIPGLTVKIAGAIFIGMIYQYYYGGGDTFTYFQDARTINSSFSDSIVTWVKLLFHTPGQFDVDYYRYTSQLMWYPDRASYTVSAVAALFGSLTFTTYLPTAVLFAAVAYTGFWALFRTFVKIYPRLVRPIAIAVLFIPSTFVWGSGIFKDTICMFALGWLTYATFRFLLQRDFSVGNVLLGVVGFVLISVVKVYILIGFVPALVLWIFFSYVRGAKSRALRIALRFAIIVIFPSAFLIAFERLGSGLGRYSLTNISETSTITRNYISSISGEEGSAYDLGDFNPEQPLSMLAKFPAAVNVTLYRPYLWESKKIISFLTGLESLLFLLATLRILFLLGFKKIGAAVSSDVNIQFCLVFSILFAFAVGISSYNFGALSRYKIPALPFYTLSLFLIYYKYNPSEKKLLYWF